MSDNTLIKENHYPKIGSGTYTVTATQNNELTGILSSKPLTFMVSGYDTAIPQHEILAVYPPLEGKGKYAGAFPHVEFRRSTLPWEFELINDKIRYPYIFLLLLEEEEIVGDKNYEKNLSQENLKSKVILSEKSSNELFDPIENNIIFKILTIPDSFHDLLPDANIYTKTTHVKVNSATSKIDFLNIPEETSVIVASRMVNPEKKYRAFICSYLEKNKEKYSLTYKKSDSNGLVEASVLYEWTFESLSNDKYQINTDKLSDYKLSPRYLSPIFNDFDELKNFVQEENNPPDNLNEEFKNDLKNGKEELKKRLKYEGKTLDGMLHELTVKPFGLDVQHGKEKPDAYNDLHNLGKVTLEHQILDHHLLPKPLRSWYNGPFVNKNYNIGALLESNNNIPGNPAELIFWNEETKMLDMTYAAAWQLGRLLILYNHKALQELKKWKTKLVINDLIEEQNRTSHLPSPARDNTADSIPAALEECIAKTLRLENIPINYLFPNQECIPNESCQFFKMDKQWMISLLYGMLSSGYELSYSLFKKHILELDSIKEIFDHEKEYYGIVMYSDIISNWPHILVELIPKVKDTADFTYVTQINPSLRLYLTDRDFSKIEIYNNKENSFYGVDYDEINDLDEQIVRNSLSLSREGNSIYLLSNKVDLKPENMLFKPPKITFEIK